MRVLNQLVADRAGFAGTVFSRSQDPDLGLSLGREILLQYGGTLNGRYRTQGGAELVIRLPMIAMPAAPETRWLGLGTGAPRSH